MKNVEEENKTDSDEEGKEEVGKYNIHKIISKITAECKAENPNFDSSAVDQEVEELKEHKHVYEDSLN